jgi:hypothetical protein
MLRNPQVTVSVMAIQMCGSYQMQFRLTRLPAVIVVSHSADVGIVLDRILSQTNCLLLLAATLLYVQAVTSVGSINTTNIQTKSGHQQLSHTIMTPHLQVEQPSLNPLSFQLTICLTQYTQSVQSNQQCTLTQPSVVLPLCDTVY